MFWCIRPIRIVYKFLTYIKYHILKTFATVTLYKFTFSFLYIISFITSFPYIYKKKKGLNPGIPKNLDPFSYSLQRFSQFLLQFLHLQSFTSSLSSFLPLWNPSLNPRVKPSLNALELKLFSQQFLQLLFQQLLQPHLRQFLPHPSQPLFQFPQLSQLLLLHIRHYSLYFY